MRKLYITNKDKAWAGVTIDDENLMELTHHFFQQTNGVVRWNLKS